MIAKGILNDTNRKSTGPARIVGIHERAEEVVAGADSSRALAAQSDHRADARVSARTVYLYAILERVKRRVRSR